MRRGCKGCSLSRGRFGHLKNNNGDVVRAASEVGEFNQPFDGLVEGILAQCECNFCIGYLAAQAIGAEQDNVP